MNNTLSSGLYSARKFVIQLNTLQFIVKISSNLVSIPKVNYFKRQFHSQTLKKYSMECSSICGL